MNYVFIRSQKKGMETYGSISARVSKNGKVYKYSLGVFIKQHEWDKIRKRTYSATKIMKSTGICYGQFASLLFHLKQQIEAHFDPSTARKAIRNTFALLAHSSKYYHRFGTSEPLLLHDYMQMYISDLRSGLRPKQRTSSPVSKGYIDVLHAALSNLLHFEQAYHTEVLLSEVTMDFQRQFVKYLRDSGQRPNTISTRMGSIRTVMRVAYLEKRTQCLDHMHPQFVPAKEPSTEIVLSPEQLTALMHLDLSSAEAIQRYISSPQLLITASQRPTAALRRIGMGGGKIVTYLNYARDIFIVGCLTGQRFSDYRRIHSGMIQSLAGRPFIALVQQKTGKQVYIPLDKRVLTILQRYGGRLPQLSAHTFRQYLHLLGELLGWTHQIDAPLSHTSIASNSIAHKHISLTPISNKPIRFCDKLSTHTARRSFATNAYSAGVRLSSIMAITGHSSERSIRTYLRLDAKEKALSAADNFEGFLLQVE